LEAWFGVGNPLGIAEAVPAMVAAAPSAARPMRADFSLMVSLLLHIGNARALKEFLGE
jgi:hypothetical protein